MPNDEGLATAPPSPADASDLAATILARIAYLQRETESLLANINARRGAIAELEHVLELLKG